MTDDHEQLSIVVERNEHQTLVRIRGELDIVTAPTFADALSEANSEIVVDFADLAFLDASGLGALARRRACPSAWPSARGHQRRPAGTTHVRAHGSRSSAVGERSTVRGSRGR